MLIKNGADVNVITKDYSLTPLHVACSYGQLVTFFLKKSSFKKLFPSKTARDLVYERIAELFIKNGAKVNLQATGGETPILLAAGAGLVHHSFTHIRYSLFFFHFLKPTREKLKINELIFHLNIFQALKRSSNF